MVIKFNLQDIKNKIKDIDRINATLNLYVNEYIPSTFPPEEFVYVAPITSNWEPSTTSWRMRTKEKKWENSYGGGDYDSTKFIKTGYVDVNNWEKINITPLVKNFLRNPDQNNGIIILSGEHTTRRSYYSSDYKKQEFRPKLIIDTKTSIENHPITIWNKAEVNQTGNTLVITPTSHEELLMSIRNIQGVLLYESSVTHKKSLSIPTDRFSRGVYMIHLRNKHTFIAQKIVIK